MFSHKSKNEFLGKEFVWLWGALAFQAGFANAGGFLACARFVSHMTGFGTLIGVSLSQFDYEEAIELISAPLSFLLGAMTSAMAVDRRVARGQRPNYLQVMAGLVLLFTVVAAGGIHGLFGPFGESREVRDFTLMSLLCFACGMQNACFASLTRGQIRTTHLTGLLTDMGVTFVKLLFVAKAREKVVLSRTNKIRLLTFFSFSIGSAVSAIVFSRIQYAGFLFLVFSSSTMLLVVAFKQHQVDRSRELNLARRGVREKAALSLKP